MSTGSPLPPSSEQKPDVQKENTPSANYIGDGKTGQRKNAPKALWECNICLETAKEPIITQCGHLYCWPCIHKYVRFSRQQEIIFSRLLISSSSSYRHIVIVTIDVSDNLSSSFFFFFSEQMADNAPYTSKLSRVQQRHRRGVAYSSIWQ
tara:strand:- start:6403 stop:6852 length:450 start_codon:yes stop_codon:yes gene_type:complete